jgi:hypothetical protein
VENEFVFKKVKWKKWSRRFFHFSSLFRTFAQLKMIGKDEIQTIIISGGNTATVM